MPNFSVCRFVQAPSMFHQLCAQSLWLSNIQASLVRRVALQAFRKIHHLPGWKLPWAQTKSNAKSTAVSLAQGDRSPFCSSGLEFKKIQKALDVKLHQKPRSKSVDLSDGLIKITHVASNTVYISISTIFQLFLTQFQIISAFASVHWTRSLTTSVAWFLLRYNMHTHAHTHTHLDMSCRKSWTSSSQSWYYVSTWPDALPPIVLLSEPFVETSDPFLWYCSASFALTPLCRGLNFVWCRFWIFLVFVTSLMQAEVHVSEEQMFSIHAAEELTFDRWQERLDADLCGQAKLGSW